VSIQELELAVAFLDVGHGDAVVVRFREGRRVRTVVVDGGGPADPGRLLSYLRRNGVETVDLMVATHVDRHHIAGLLPVLADDSIGVENFWGPACESAQPSVAGLRLPDERAYQRLYSRVRARVPENGILNPVRGQALPPLFAEAAITVLNPTTPNVLRAPAKGAPTKNPQDLLVEQNHASMVLLLECHGLRILLGGDSQPPFWTAAAADPVLHRLLDVNILKAPFYGRTSIAPAAFAGGLRTEYAVFSIGRKIDKQPAPEVVAVLRQMGAEILCTQHALPNTFCGNPHCHAAHGGQNIVFCRCRGEASYSTGAYSCPPVQAGA